MSNCLVSRVRVHNKNISASVHIAKLTFFLRCEFWPILHSIFSDYGRFSLWSIFHPEGGCPPAKFAAVGGVCVCVGGVPKVSSFAPRGFIGERGSVHKFRNGVFKAHAPTELRCWRKGKKILLARRLKSTR